MVQNDRKGQPPSTRGRSPAPSAPDTPDTRDINAPPPPEAPETRQEAEPVDAVAGDGTVDAGEELESGENVMDAQEGGGGQEGAGGQEMVGGGVTVGGEEVTGGEEVAGGEEGVGGGGPGGANAGGAGGESESDRLRREIGETEKALEAKKAELARAEERRKAEEATAKMVADYAAEIPALTATEDGLRQYKLAQTSFLSKYLDAATMQKIADASAALQREIDELAAQIEADSETAAAKKAGLDAAKAKAAAAKAKAEALKRPGASIRDRLKAAEAIRAEADKASDAGNYALAYWLIMDGGRLDEKVRAEPRVIPKSELDAAVRQSAADQAAAEREVAALEGEVKALDAGLQADRAQLAALNAKFEAKVRDSLAQFNPKPAAAA
jgi:hypothetical protein